jgi:putative tricarboxylic transport membrane protein
MESFQYFSIVFDPGNLFYALIGVCVGTLVGVLPGIGPVGAISILLPTTFKLSPIQAIIMLAGIFYGSQYGGSTTSILVNIPGEAASVVTCLDGYQMARKGRAGPALAMAAIASFIAGTISIIGLQLLAPFLVKIALKFGPPEYFSLMLVGLSLVSYLAQKSVAKAIMMAGLGIMLSTIGLDPISSMPRYTFHVTGLRDGVGLVPLAMGLFGISEVLISIEGEGKKEVLKTKLRDLLCTLQDWKDSMWPLLRGSLIGFFLGILPGGGPTLASFVSYTVEKKVSSHPEKLGTGVIEGVAAPEAANNAAAGGSFVPLLSLGIPCNAVMAVLLGALMIHGIQFGPLLLVEHPDIFWSVVVSMYVGNVMLLILNLPFIGIWVQVLRVPYPILYPFILFFCVVGAYTLNNSVVDVIIMIFFGFFGYLLRKFEFELAPLVMAFVLGPLMETSLRQSLIISRKSLAIFIKHPIAAAGIILVVLIMTSPLFPGVRKKRAVIEKLE